METNYQHKALTTSGERVRRARYLAGIMTRKELKLRHDISENTLRSWEKNHNKLNERSAIKLVRAFKKEGLLCTIEWLLHGTGVPPQTFTASYQSLSNDQRVKQNISELDLKEALAIESEKQHFLKNSSNAIVISVADDALEPYFLQGDYVGGYRINGDDMAKFIDTICIVELKDESILPRYLQAGVAPDCYTLVNLNPRGLARPLVIDNVELVSIAPIVWSRRKLSQLIKP